jgi:hypothetical protein
MYLCAAGFLATRRATRTSTVRYRNSLKRTSPNRGGRLVPLINNAAHLISPRVCLCVYVMPSPNWPVVLDQPKECLPVVSWLQQAYHATSVIRQMQRLALNSSSASNLQSSSQSQFQQQQQQQQQHPGPDVTDPSGGANLNHQRF